MADIPLPDLPRRAIRAVTVEHHELAGESLFTVTLRCGAGQPPRRKWFAARSIAFAHAAEAADRDGLALIDLTGEAE